ncbi:MAG: hypothetical protein QG671_1768 [Actinomycetota bacterium]|nr:hypothetical protein [Actinomycetota bacterium]
MILCEFAHRAEQKIAAGGYAALASAEVVEQVHSVGRLAAGATPGRPATFCPTRVARAARG